MNHSTSKVFGSVFSFFFLLSFQLMADKSHHNTSAHGTTNLRRPHLEPTSKEISIYIINDYVRSMENPRSALFVPYAGPLQPPQRDLNQQDLFQGIKSLPSPWANQAPSLSP